MAYTKYSLTPANNTAAPPDGAPEGMLPSAVNDTMRDMMAQIRDAGDGIRNGTYTMTAPVITGGSITGVALSGNTLTNPVITGGSINNTPIGATTANTGRFSDLTDTGLTSGRVIYASTGGNLVDDADFTFNGTTVTMANDASISGLTVGKGGGAVSNNTVVGSGAGTANTTGAVLTAIGRSALSQNTTGLDLTAVGYLALGSNTTGSYHVAVGQNALGSNTTATRSVAVGWNAAGSTTTGEYQAVLGFNALNANTTGGNNTAIGAQALNSNTTASNNTAVGYQAGYSTTTGAGNTWIGRVAGYSNVTGSNNIIIGQGDVQNTAASYQYVMGDIASIGDNTFSFGKSGNVVYNSFISNNAWTRSSDERLKTNIQDDTLGLAFICKVQPKTFQWKPSYDVPQELTRHYSETNNMATDVVINGFIAQEIKQALDEVNAGHQGIWSVEPDGTQAISREMLIMPLINAVKELNAKVTALEAQLGAK